MRFLGLPTFGLLICLALDGAVGCNKGGLVVRRDASPGSTADTGSAAVFDGGTAASPTMASDGPNAAMPDALGPFITDMASEPTAAEPEVWGADALAFAAEVSRDPAQVTLETMVPPESAIPGFSFSEPVKFLRNDSDLYQELDGAAPKYIDRGWNSGAVAKYSNTSVPGCSFVVGIFDMNTPENALSLHASELPVKRKPIPGTKDGVIDMGLSNGYVAEATFGRYFVNVTTDDLADRCLLATEDLIRAIVR